MLKFICNKVLVLCIGILLYWILSISISYVGILFRIFLYWSFSYGYWSYVIGVLVKFGYWRISYRYCLLFFYIGVLVLGIGVMLLGY